MSQEIKTEETKNVGGQIPNDLYWEFKAKQAERKENATTALTNAIRLYNDVDTMTNAIEAQDIIKASGITTSKLEKPLYQLFIDLGMSDDGQIAIVLEQIFLTLDTETEVE